jgi:predicted dehydrogenase
MRFGLLGTGHWAAEVHAAALAADTAVEFVGVWGRNSSRAATLAERYGSRAYADPDELLAEVDAVSFALPPDVQADLAQRFGAAGKHLLLDKPLALSAAGADAVVSAAEHGGAASVVFFTSRFDRAVADWLGAARAQTWHGARAIWLGSLLDEGNPYAESPWRQVKGGLWDLGPHALALAIPLLGPVSAVTAAAEAGDRTTHAVLEHERGGWTTLATSLAVPPAAATFELSAYGPAGWTTMRASPSWAAGPSRSTTIPHRSRRISNMRATPVSR